MAVHRILISRLWTSWEACGTPIGFVQLVGSHAAIVGSYKSKFEEQIFIKSKKRKQDQEPRNCITFTDIFKFHYHVTLEQRWVSLSSPRQYISWENISKKFHREQ